VVGVWVHPWCGHTRASPIGHLLALVDSWLGLGGSLGGARPIFGDWMGLCLIPLRKICFTLSMLHLFGHIPMYFMNKSCKTLNLQYMWKYVNSECMCQKCVYFSYFGY
jgi:hypothetical protein